MSKKPNSLIAEAEAYAKEVADVSDIIRNKSTAHDIATHLYDTLRPQVAKMLKAEGYMDFDIVIEAMSKGDIRITIVSTSEDLCIPDRLN